MKQWQIQEAKARMSELIKQSHSEAQEITLHGKPVAVVMSRSQYEQLTGQHESLLDFMQRSPLADVDTLELERDKSPGREIQL